MNKQTQYDSQDYNPERSFKWNAVMGMVYGFAQGLVLGLFNICLLYTSDAADE